MSTMKKAVLQGNRFPMECFLKETRTIISELCAFMLIFRYIAFPGFGRKAFQETLIKVLPRQGESENPGI